MGSFAVGVWWKFSANMGMEVAYVVKEERRGSRVERGGEREMSGVGVRVKEEKEKGVTHKLSKCPSLSLYFYFCSKLLKNWYH